MFAMDDRGIPARLKYLSLCTLEIYLLGTDRCRRSKYTDALFVYLCRRQPRSIVRQTVIIRPFGGYVFIVVVRFSVCFPSSCYPSRSCVAIHTHTIRRFITLKALTHGRYLLVMRVQVIVNIYIAIDRIKYIETRIR
jgi:hypothetical protein